MRTYPLTKKRQAPVSPPALKLTLDLIGLSDFGNFDGFNGFNERLQAVEDPLELCAVLDFLRVVRQHEFVQLIVVQLIVVQLIEAHRDRLMLAKLPQAQGITKGGKRL